MMTIFSKIQSIYMQFVCEYALENAINSVLDLQKCKNFLGRTPRLPFLPKLSMRVPINHQKLYYNYYTYNPPTSPPLPNVRCFATSLMVVFETDFSFKISLVCSSKWIHKITYSLF
jgi:hypothetical protein